MSKKALQGGGELPAEKFINSGDIKTAPTGSGESADKPKSGGMEQGLRTRTGAPSMKQGPQPSGMRGCQMAHRLGGADVSYYIAFIASASIYYLMQKYL